MKIAIGADHRGRGTMTHLADALHAQGHEVTVHGPCGEHSCDYPDAAYPVATLVAAGKADRGILICGTGIGMCIAANKVPGIRAALVHDEIGADMSRRHNDANILCLSADLLGVPLIDKIVQRWLSTSFAGGRHARRLRKIVAIEQGRDPATLADSGDEDGASAA